jgi:hypothetical protein
MERLNVVHMLGTLEHDTIPVDPFLHAAGARGATGWWMISRWTRGQWVVYVVALLL